MSNFRGSRFGDLFTRLTGAPCRKTCIVERTAQSLNQEQLGKKLINESIGFVKRGIMNTNDLKRAGLLAMLILLVGAAPQWLNPANQHVSNYDAPWIYPSLSPSSH
jgi:hypothetical protein